MKFSTITSSLAFVAVATAQSSPGAPYDVGNYFPTSWNNSVTNEPGMLFGPNQVASSPAFGAVQTTMSGDQPYLVIIIDPDVVLNASTGIKSQFLHLLQPNLYATSQMSGNLTVNANGINASIVVGQSYYSPDPPAGSTHNYNIFLFEQPTNFTIPSMFNRLSTTANLTDRANFNVTMFASESGLGQPIAANYFRVLNGTAAQTLAVVSQTATSGVAFPSGFSFSTSSSSATTTAESGTAVSSSTSNTMTASSSAASPSTSASSASDSVDLGQAFVKAVCMAVAASLPWIW